MTVSSTENRKQYAGDGVTTSFATSPVVFFVAADLILYVVNNTTGAVTNLTLGTHYTVSGGAGAVGTVNLAAGSSPYGAPATGTTLVIVRDLAVTQAVDFVNNDSSDAEVAEDALDRLTMIAQQQATKIARSFTLPDSDVSGASTQLPTPEASSLLGWNSAGAALQNYDAAFLGAALVSTFMSTVLDDVDAATARTTLDVPSNAEAVLDTIIGAKGDLIVGTVANTPARLAVGSDGTQLIADSLQASGVRWGQPTRPTRTVYTTGSGTFTTPAGATRINVRVVGAGAGGGGSGGGGGLGGAGGNTTFAALIAYGGSASVNQSLVQNDGGTALNGDINIQGGPGGSGTGATPAPGGVGGSAAFLGMFGAGGATTAGGGSARANSGGGGGGGGSTASGDSGNGGGAGGYAEKLIASPAASYSYAVGAAGTAGAAGTGGTPGGAGGSGLIIVDVYYD